MTLQMGITLAVLIFMILSFFIGKLPYGLIAMTCVIILGLTGVVDAETAFSGFSNMNTVLIATMFVVNVAVGKTSFSVRLKDKIAVLQKRNGYLLVAGLIGFCIVLSQLMGMTGVMSFMLLVIQSLDDDSEVCQSRMYFLMAAVVCAWFGRFPIGMYAAYPFITNALYEEMVGGNQDYLLGIFDVLKAGIIPSIVMTIYCFIAWKLIPRTKIDVNALGAVGGPKGEQQFSKKVDIIVVIMLIVIIISLMLNGQLGNYSFLIPAACVLVLIYTKIISVQEAVRALTSDTMWMAAGILVVSSALTNSGAADLIGQGLLRVLGDNPSGLYVSFVFSLVSVVLTTFLNNTAVMITFTPIAASVALAGGMNPRSVVLVVFLSSTLGLAFPTASNMASMAFAVCHHNPLKTAKFCIPFLLLGVVSITLCCNLFFPVY